MSNRSHAKYITHDYSNYDLQLDFEFKFYFYHESRFDKPETSRERFETQEYGDIEPCGVNPKNIDFCSAMTVPKPVNKFFIIRSLILDFLIILYSKISYPSIFSNPIPL